MVKAILGALKWLGKGTAYTAGTAGKVIKVAKGHKILTVAGAGYAISKTTGKPLVDIAAPVVDESLDTVFGDERVDAVNSWVGETADTLSTAAETAKSAIGGIAGATQQVTGGMMSGIGGLFQSLTSGLSSSMNIGGLVIGSLLLFGRSGLLGKIGGLLLLGSLLGGNTQSRDNIAELARESQRSLSSSQGLTAGQDMLSRGSEASHSLGWGR